jgi:hypothetical protein
MSQRRKANRSRLTKALRETAYDMRRVGILDEKTHKKITLRHRGDRAGSACNTLAVMRYGRCGNELG